MSLEPVPNENPSVWFCTASSAISFFFAARVTTYEIKNKLLTHILFPVDVVEYLFELFKLFERSFRMM